MGGPQQQLLFLMKFWHLVRKDTKRRKERQENNPLPRASKCSEVLPWLTSVGMSIREEAVAGQVFRTTDTSPQLPSFFNSAASVS